MSAQHTPGPWVLEMGPTEVEGVEVRFAVRSKHRFSIASGQSQEHLGSDGLHKEECESNARLIAAAPEMLDVLLLAPVILHTVPNGECSCGMCEFARARAAVIAKATGSAS